MSEVLKTYKVNDCSCGGTVKLTNVVVYDDKLFLIMSCIACNKKLDTTVDTQPKQQDVASEVQPT